MEELRFDGRTAVITGAGGNPGLGRAYALLLAERGANVVVNDIGAVPEVPAYEGIASPEAVAEEIRTLGGKAISDGNDISNERGATALIKTALDAFGRIDILVNNAALCILASFDEISSRHYRRIIETNLMGPVWTSRAAWPHMKAISYGRIVNIGAAVFGGTRLMSAYGVSKGGLFMLSQTLAVEGHAYGIKANTVNPIGFSRMVPALQQEASVLFQQLHRDFPPEVTAPLVAFLAHENCPVSGECFDTAGGRVNRTIIARNEGFMDAGQTVETIATRWGEVMDTASARVMAGVNFDSGKWAVRPYGDYAEG